MKTKKGCVFQLFRNAKIQNKNKKIICSTSYDFFLSNIRPSIGKMIEDDEMNSDKYKMLMRFF